MKSLFVGDIHGRIEVMEFVEKQFPEHQKIFVGDLVDSFDRTRRQQLACVEKAFTMIERGDTRVILGNHELSYLVPREMRCSGFGESMAAMLLPLKSDIWKKFDHYVWMAEHKLLVTHAGLTDLLWTTYALTLENLPAKLDEWKLAQWDTSPNGWIGKSRGGRNPVGGIFWCDFNDEFRPVKGLKQVFGHTSFAEVQHDLSNGIRSRKGGNYCIDCLARSQEFLEFDSDRKTHFKALHFDSIE